MNYLDAAKKGYKLFKTVTESYKFIKEVKENVGNVDKTITEIEETITESKKVISKGNSFLHRKNDKKDEQDKEPYAIIVKPITDNKLEIYEWMYNESENVKELLLKRLKELSTKKENEIISFRVDKSRDRLLFTVYNLSDWKGFKDSLLMETFALKPRLEKLNNYDFDEQDKKRINESKKLVSRLNEPKSNLEIAYSFRNTDKLLAAYYYREFLNIFLFEFSRTKTLEEMTLEEREEYDTGLNKALKELETRAKKQIEEIKKNRNGLS